MNNVVLELAEVKLQNKEILHELSVIEDILKNLLVNNLLSDTEKIVYSKENSELNIKEKCNTTNVDSEKEINALKADIEYFENKLKKWIGKKVRIRYECSDFYDENMCKIAPSNNIHLLDYNIADYNYGMFLLTCETKKHTYNYWVSFDMVI